MHKTEGHKEEGHQAEKGDCCGGKEGCEAKGCCGCVCHRVLPIIVILIGLAYLLGELGVLTLHMVKIICPALIIVAGLKLVMGKVCKCCNRN